MKTNRTVRRGAVENKELFRSLCDPKAPRTWRETSSRLSYAGDRMCLLHILEDLTTRAVCRADKVTSFAYQKRSPRGPIRKEHLGFCDGVTGNCRRRATTSDICVRTAARRSFVDRLRFKDAVDARTCNLRGSSSSQRVNMRAL